MKVLKWIAIVVLGLFIIGFVGMKYMTVQTKKHSPEETVTYTENGYDLSLTYSRPYKKDREVYGGLVPYGQVWRTGANEPTMFTTKTDLLIDGETLPAGTYSLWTIPNQATWELIFNNGDYGWGVGFDQVASRDAEFDVLVTESNSLKNFKVLEQFTIDFEGDPAVMMIGWDDTRVDVVMEQK